MKESFTYPSWNAKLLYGENETSVSYDGVLRSFVDGVPLPMYRSIISNKGDATTPLNASRETLDVSTFPVYRGIDTSTDTKFAANVWGNPYTLQYLSQTDWADSSLIVSDADSIALSNAHSKVRQFANPFEAGVFLSEFKQTIDLLKDPFSALAHLYKDFARKRASLGSSAKAVSDSWLEFRFGILPLVQDINSIIELSNRVALKNEIFRFKSYGKAEIAYSETNPYGVIYGTTSDQMFDWKKRAEVFYHFGILASTLDRANSLQEGMEDILDISKFIPTVWERIPYSFLADYFVNVGDIISATFDSQYETSYCSRSVVTTVECSWRFSPMRSKYEFVIVDPTSTPFMLYKRREVVRTQSSLGIPPLRFSVPGSSIRKTNIAALLTSFLTRRS